jgi:four helix bundle protein
MKHEGVILIDDMEIYQLAMEIGEMVWEVVGQWDNFAKNTVGTQLVRSADSIAANFSEGYGRFTFKDRKNFCYISRGSMFETRTWIRKAKNRMIIDELTFNKLYQMLAHLHLKLNTYIKSLKENIK